MKTKTENEIFESKKYYKIGKGFFVHYLSTNRESAEKIAREKGLKVTEISKEKYIWLSLSFRPENFIE